MFRSFISERTTSLRHLRAKQNQSGNDGTWAVVESLKKPATTNRDNLLDPTIFVIAHTCDSAKIGLSFETTIVSRQKNLFGIVDRTDRFDPLRAP